MPALTLKQIRDQVDPTCFPPAATDDQKTYLSNKCREIVFYTPAQGGLTLWKGLQTPVVLSIVTQPDNSRTITLPRTLETMLGLWDCTGIRTINPQWYSFLRVPPPGAWRGINNGNWQGGTITDMGDGWCGVQDINQTTGANASITTVSNEAGGKTLTFIGKDVNGNFLTEALAIPVGAGTSVTGTAVFYAITEVVKSAATSGFINAYLSVAGVKTFYARYDPGELMANYRRYAYTGWTSITVINAFCSRRYYLLSGDNDPCEVESVIAMEMALKAYRWFQNASMETYRTAVNECIAYLNAELQRYVGPTEYGTMRIDPTVGMGRIPVIV